jgi:hypothetical protein
MSSSHQPVIIVDDGQRKYMLSNARKWRRAIDARMITWETPIEYEVEADNRISMAAGDCPVLTDILLEMLGPRPIAPLPIPTQEAEQEDELGIEADRVPDAEPDQDINAQEANISETNNLEDNALAARAANDALTADDESDLEKRLAALEREVDAAADSVPAVRKSGQGLSGDKKAQRGNTTSPSRPPAYQPARRKSSEPVQRPWGKNDIFEGLMTPNVKQGDKLPAKRPVTIPPEENNAFSFAGRIGRSTFFAHSAGAFFIWLILLGWLGENSSWLGIASIALIWVALAASVKRCRDMGITPWWLLVGLVPAFGIILLLGLLFSPTKNGK